MSCNPSTIQATGKDFYKLSQRDLTIVKIRLLCIIVLAQSPATDVTASAVMLRGKDFYKLSERELDVAIDELKCLLTGGCVTPAAPTGFNVGLFPNPVTISWLGPAMDPDSTQIWKSVNAAAYTLLTTVLGGTNSYVDAGPFVDGDVVCYKIRFVVGACLGNYTTPNCQTISNPP